MLAPAAPATANAPAGGARLRLHRDHNSSTKSNVFKTPKTYVKSNDRTSEVATLVSELGVGTEEGEDEILDAGSETGSPEVP